MYSCTYVVNVLPITATSGRNLIIGTRSISTIVRCQGHGGLYIACFSYVRSYVRVGCRRHECRRVLAYFRAWASRPPSLARRDEVTTARKCNCCQPRRRRTRILTQNRNVGQKLRHIITARFCAAVGVCEDCRWRERGRIPAHDVG